MQASVLDAERFTFNEAAKKAGCHVSAIFRWASHGVGGVKLRVTRFGGRSYILREHLEEFIARRSDPPAPIEAAEDAAKRADDAGRRLSALGL